MHFAWPEEAGATVFYVGEGEPDLTPMQNVLHGREIEVRRVAATNAVDILKSLAEEKMI